MFGRTLAVMIVSAGLISAPLPAQARQPAAADPATEPAGEPEVGPAPQQSGDLERAKELYVNGQQLYGEGSYEAAILAFKEGYQLSKKPEFLYNIANAYERMGEFGQARDYLDQFRAYASNDQQEALARKIASLDKRQREKEANAQQQQDQAAHEAAARERRRQEPPIRRRRTRSGALRRGPCRRSRSSASAWGSASACARPTSATGRSSHAPRIRRCGSAAPRPRRPSARRSSRRSSRTWASSSARPRASR